MGWKSGALRDVPGGSLGFQARRPLVLDPWAVRFKPGQPASRNERDGGRAIRPIPPFADQANLQSHADDRAGHGQGENDEIGARHAVKGGFKSGERAEHDGNSSVCVNPVGLPIKSLVQSGQRLDSTNLSVVQIIFTVLG